MYDVQVAHGQYSCAGRGDSAIQCNRTQFIEDVRSYIRLFYKPGFLDVSRKLNLLFAFTSVGVTEVPLTAGPPSYKIRGQLVHKLGSYRPKDNLAPQFAQVYVLDANAQASLRSSRADQMTLRASEKEAIRCIQAFMMRHNHFSRTLCTVKERMDQLLQGTDMDDQICVAIRPRGGRDARTHNAPTAPEMAICMRHEVGTIGRDVVVMPRHEQLLHVSEVSSAYNPLQYPLLFPFAQGGWDFTMKEDPQNPTSKRLSLFKYTKFTMYQRHPFSPLHMSGKIGQQYWTDQYCREETNSLRWIVENQKKIRADMYRNVQDAIAGEHEFDATTMGRRVILPATYTGSDRYMARSYQNSMAIVRKFGRPHLFITFTCNPQWKEIVDGLAYFQTLSGLNEPTPAHYRGDLISRVFKMKLKQLKTGIMGGKFFGPVQYCFYVVEFQKRGLPHAHILVRLKKHIEKPEEIDGFVSAELPDATTQPRLYRTITTHNIHKCNERCLVKNKCSKRFPKEFCDSTRTDEDGYPCYRRRAIDPRNAFVVPHCPVLSLVFDCHINVEVCSTIASIKYLYKYVYKGVDKADVTVTCGDEVSNHRSMRFVSYIEACWHNLGFRCQWSSHSVEALPVHLPGMQAVRLPDESVVQCDEVRHRGESTELTRFFEVCSLATTQRNHPSLKYSDVVDGFVWHSKPRKWLPRKNMTNTIARLQSVSPRDKERYCLRVLLIHRSLPTSYESLRTVNGTVHALFEDACIALGLMEADVEWFNCMDEGQHFRLPKSLRNLFCIILCFCNPTDVNKLWTQYYPALSEDFEHRFTGDPNKNINVLGRTLMDVDRNLQSMGSSLQVFVDSNKLPPIPDAFVGDISLDPNPCIADEMRFLASEKPKLESLRQGLDTGTQEHKDFFARVMSALNEPSGGRMFFLEGEGGSGKTYISQIILAEVRLRGKIALAVASSGLAALLLMGGRTAHNRFGIPTKETTDTMSCTYNVKSNQSALLKQAALIIWDEVSMVHRYAIEAVDRMFQDIMKNDRPFGGKVIIFSGDFKQLLPVIPLKAKLDPVHATLPFSRQLWPTIDENRVRLTVNMRLRSQGLSAQDMRDMEKFSRFILSIGHGTAPTIDGQVRLPDNIVMPYEGPSTVKDLVRKIYGQLTDPLEYRLWPMARRQHFFAERAILAPKNTDITCMNNAILSMLLGPASVYTSADSIVEDGDALAAEESMLMFPVEFLNTLDISGFPKHELCLKVGAPIMLLRNLCPANGLCNGTRLIITALDTNIIQAKIMAGDFAGREVMIPRIKLIDDSNSRWPFQLQRRQFPVSLAFAMTIHKAQGQSLEHVGMYLPEPIFSHGQLYVALSRVTSHKNIHVVVRDGTLSGQPT